MFVLTHAVHAPPVAGFSYVTGEIADVVDTVTAAAGDQYVAILGPGAAKSVLDAGLLDEVLVHVAPVLLGDGVRLFEHLGGTQVRLEPLSVTSGAAAANLRYRVAR